MVASLRKYPWRREIIPGVDITLGRSLARESQEARHATYRPLLRIGVLVINSETRRERVWPIRGNRVLLGVRQRTAPDAGSFAHRNTMLPSQGRRDDLSKLKR